MGATEPGAGKMILGLIASAVKRQKKGKHRQVKQAKTKK